MSTDLTRTTAQRESIKCPVCAVPWNEHTAECPRHEYRPGAQQPREVPATLIGPFEARPLPDEDPRDDGPEVPGEGERTSDPELARRFAEMLNKAGMVVDEAKLASLLRRLADKVDRLTAERAAAIETLREIADNEGWARKLAIQTSPSTLAIDLCGRARAALSRATGGAKGE